MGMILPRTAGAFAIARPWMLCALTTTLLETAAIRRAQRAAMLASVIECPKRHSGRPPPQLAYQVGRLAFSRRAFKLTTRAPGGTWERCGPSALLSIRSTGSPRSAKSRAKFSSTHLAPPKRREGRKRARHSPCLEGMAIHLHHLFDPHF